MFSLQDKADDMTWIQAKHLKKYYGKGQARAQILSDVSFEVAQSDFLAIMGTSGSGKTTLLNILGGLDRAYEGQAHVLGHALEQMSEGALARLRHESFGFVFQQFHLLEHLTSLENVLLPSFFGSSPSDGPARAQALLERVGLADKSASRPGELSGGQRQRVAIARALFNRPKILFCDEPTGSLDRQTGQSILELFETLNREDDVTLVMVTHEEHIAQRAGRILRVEDGRLVSDTPTKAHE